MMLCGASDRVDTVLVNAGRDPAAFGGAVNTPPVRTSTVLYADLQSYEASRSQKFGTLRYGRYGTQTAFALQDVMCRLEGADGTTLYPSGLAAIVGTLRAVVQSGDHVLVVDSVYGPARKFCEDALRRDGIEVEFYDPLISAGIGELLRPNTRAVYCEAPGSLTFEMQDIGAIARICRPRNVLVLVDNTWATPYLFRPLDHGADISIHAATKYIVGHSDAMLGMACARAPVLEALRSRVAEDGIIASPDDCWLALRGLRTLGVRLRQHGESALAVAEWLSAHSAVKRVLFPALPTDPGHAIWRRDFRGASGLLGVELHPAPRAAMLEFFDRLRLFGIGSSWGGFESLILPSKPTRNLPADWGNLIRLHIGLEDTRDLIADLGEALAALRDYAHDNPEEIVK